MRKASQVDEQTCLICLEPIETLVPKKVCSRCRKQMHVLREEYHIEGVSWFVLYEYNEFIERLFFQYKEQRDIALASVFLDSYENDVRKLIGKRCMCGLCSSSEKNNERGFDALEHIFLDVGCSYYSPLYKRKNVKQSQLNREERKVIQNVIARKQYYPLKSKSCVVVDDVCTTGSSVQAALELLGAKRVFVVAAHPLWLEAHAKNKVVKHKGIW